MFSLSLSTYVLPHIYIPPIGFRVVVVDYYYYYYLIWNREPERASKRTFRQVYTRSRQLLCAHLGPYPLSTRHASSQSTSGALIFLFRVRSRSGRMIGHHHHHRTVQVSPPSEKGFCPPYILRNRSAHLPGIRRPYAIWPVRSSPQRPLRNLADQRARAPRVLNPVFSFL